MKIQKITIKNFRWIKEIIDFELKNLSVFIWDNWTSKTSILEAINFALSPSFLSWRIKHTDFYCWWDLPIEIKILFEEDFMVMLPDWFTKQKVECNWVYLEISKRNRSTPNKAFSDIVTIKHYVIPSKATKANEWWIHKRKNWSDFRISERLLNFPLETEWLPKSFYFWKNREKQLYKGFNSSLSTIIDDFNWRFHKNIRKKSNWWNDFYVDTCSYEESVLSNIDENIHNKTIQELNKKLKDFNLPEIDFSIVNKLEPFDNAFLVQKKNELQLPISNLGSWIEILISILLLETMALLSQNSIIIIIDEPELHLHPNFQKILINYLQKISNNFQIILSTHSPFLFNWISKNKNPNTELLLTNKTGESLKIINTWKNFWLFPWSPSWWEINFFAYNLATIEFHNELYWYLQEKNPNWKNSLKLDKDYIDKRKVDWKKRKIWGGLTDWELDELKEKKSLHEFIRHIIHHPENTYNSYKENELKESIEEMIDIITNNPK